MIKKHKTKIISALAIATMAVLAWVFLGRNEASLDQTSKCEQGTFETTVSAIGEIQAVKSLDILIPEALNNRETRIYNLKIIDMVAEGTMVQKGDYVASLDPSDVETELKRILDNLTNEINAREEAKLDSGLRLSSLRTDLRNAKDALVEKQIKVEQSAFESKAYQRQASIELERATRELEQKKRNYQQQIRRHELILERRNNDVVQVEKKRDILLQLKDDLKIKAPSDGMLLYGKSWRGNKIKVGDDVGRFMPLIATLPDLTQLVSEAFVQEVDIKHVTLGQQVKIAIDAFPNIKFTGKVVAVANIGQKMPGKEMNGFKATIAIDPTSEKILPGMTTNNTIVTGTWDNALMLPRPAVFGNDSLSYVFVKSALAIKKQQVSTAGENDTHFMISKGVNKGDKVLMTKPADADKMELTIY
jgi:HlyD family secretion protein